MFHQRRFLHKTLFLALISRFLQTQGAAAMGTSAGPQCVTEVNKVFPHTAHNPNDLVQEVAVITEQSTYVFPVRNPHRPVG